MTREVNEVAFSHVVAVDKRKSLSCSRNSKLMRIKTMVILYGRNFYKTARGLPEHVEGRAITLIAARIKDSLGTWATTRVSGFFTLSYSGATLMAPLYTRLTPLTFIIRFYLQDRLSGYTSSLMGPPFVRSLWELIYNLAYPVCTLPEQAEPCQGQIYRPACPLYISSYSAKTLHLPTEDCCNLRSNYWSRPFQNLLYESIFEDLRKDVWTVECQHVRLTTNRMEKRVLDRPALRNWHSHWYQLTSGKAHSGRWPIKSGMSSEENI